MLRFQRRRSPYQASTAYYSRGRCGDQVQKQKDGEPVPEPFRFTRRDLINYGYTTSCPGCLSAANDLRHRPHTAACRKRLEEAMLADELGLNRVKDARVREDADLERAVRAADEASQPELKLPRIAEEVWSPRRPLVRRAPATNTSRAMSWEEWLQINSSGIVRNCHACIYGHGCKTAASGVG